MTCKDCLHYEACKGTYFALEERIIDKNSFDNEHYADIYNCPDFTDRSEWMHLPCKIGDTVYYITGIHNRLIKSAIIKEITFDQNKIVSLFITDEDGMSFENDIDTFYLSYEEAEKALED